MILSVLGWRLARGIILRFSQALRLQQISLIVTWLADHCALVLLHYEALLISKLVASTHTWQIWTKKSFEDGLNSRLQ
jgi:hypothetical protein